jgi:hypothetical protein
VKFLRSSCLYPSEAVLREFSYIEAGYQHTQFRSVILTRQSFCIRCDRSPSLGRELGRCFFRHGDNFSGAGRFIEPRNGCRMTCCLTPQKQVSLGKIDDHMRDIRIPLLESYMLAKRPIVPRKCMALDASTREADSYPIGSFSYCLLRMLKRGVLSADRTSALRHGKLIE